MEFIEKLGWYTILGFVMVKSWEITVAVKNKINDNEELIQ